MDVDSRCEKSSQCRSAFKLQFAGFNGLYWQRCNVTFITMFPITENIKNNHQWGFVAFEPAVYIHTLCGFFSKCLPCCAGLYSRTFMDFCVFDYKCSCSFKGKVKHVNGPKLQFATSLQDDTNFYNNIHVQLARFHDMGIGGTNLTYDFMRNYIRDTHIWSCRFYMFPCFNTPDSDQRNSSRLVQTQSFEEIHFIWIRCVYVYDFNIRTTCLDSVSCTNSISFYSTKEDVAHNVKWTIHSDMDKVLAQTARGRLWQSALQVDICRARTMRWDLSGVR